MDNWRSIISLLVVLLTALVYAGVDDEQVFRDSFESIASIRITPGTVLLTVQGESQTLTAEAFDEDGQPIADVDFVWTSNDGATVTVDTAGKITAANSIGSALITVRAADAQSAPVLVIIAEPVANSVLVSDEQVVGDPEAVDPEAEYVLGFQYRVILTDISEPQIGDILLGRGEKPIGGRVVSVVDLGNGQFDVTLELIDLDEMFANLVIDEEVDLSDAEFEVPDQVAQLYDFKQQSDGSLLFTLKDNAEAPIALQKPRALSSLVSPAMATGTTALGPFACEITGTLPFTLPQNPTPMSWNHSLNFELIYNSSQGGLQKIAVKGGINVDARIKPVLSAVLNSEFVCKGEMFTITIPIGGPVALIMGGQVPIWAGISAGGKLTLLQLGFDMLAKGSASAEVGLECPGGTNCAVVAPEPTVSFDTDFKFLFPDPNNVSNQVQFEPKIGAFLYAELAIGPRFFSSLRLSAFEIKSGPTLTANLGSVQRQVLDEQYKSDYKLTFDSTIGVAGGFSSMLNLLGLAAATKLAEFPVDIAKSPKALSFTQDSISGSPYSGTLKLDPATINFTPFGYNVESIRLYGSDGTNVSLIREFPALTGQTDFDLTWASIPAMFGNNFYAFVDTVALPDVPLFTDLEQIYACPSTKWVENFLNREKLIFSEDDVAIDGQIGASIFTDFGLGLEIFVDTNTGTVTGGTARIHALPCSDGEWVTGDVVSGNVSGVTLTIDVSWSGQQKLQSNQCESEYNDRMPLPDTTSFTLDVGVLCTDIGGSVTTCGTISGLHSMGPTETAIVYGASDCV